MKKKLSSFLKKSILISAMLLTTSCSSPDEVSNSTPTFSQSDDASANAIAEIGGVDYGFIDASTVNDDSQLTLNNATKPTTFDVLKTYYCIISFTVAARNNNMGTSLFETQISFSNAEFVDGNVYSSKSGEKPSKSTVKNSSTGDDEIVLIVDSKVPANINETKNISIVIKMTTLQYSESYMYCIFSTKGSTKLLGDANGFGKSLNIIQVKLDAPELSFNDETLELQFPHIEHADYYKAYVDGYILKDSDSMDVIYIVDKYTSKGNVISWDLTSYINDVHRVKIQAFSNSANFITSDYSNEVLVNM